jgi:hypothetical protein
MSHQPKTLPRFNNHSRASLNNKKDEKDLVA